MMSRHVCTKENPWTREKGRSQHPDAKDTGRYGDGFYEQDDWDEYQCPHCGLVFKVSVSK